MRKAAYKKKRRKQDGGALEGRGSDADADEDDKDPQESNSSKSMFGSRPNTRLRSQLVRGGVLEKLPPQKGKYKKVSQRRKDAAVRDRAGNWEPDMYKMMDGSALVCTGT
jgi:hypothetical protein